MKVGREGEGNNKDVGRKRKIDRKTGRNKREEQKRGRKKNREEKESSIETKRGHKREKKKR